MPHGDVIPKLLSSPFEAFNRYEGEIGLPKDFIRSLNAHNPDGNAWEISWLDSLHTI